MLKTTLSKIENGQRTVDVDELVALSLALRVAPLWMLVGRGEPQSPIALAPQLVTFLDDAWWWSSTGSALTPAPTQREALAWLGIEQGLEDLKPPRWIDSPEPHEFVQVLKRAAESPEHRQELRQLLLKILEPPKGKLSTLPAQPTGEAQDRLRPSEQHGGGKRPQPRIEGVASGPTEDQADQDR
jgi:transcriptional regulator with XRE-family HTH domain